MINLFKAVTFSGTYFLKGCLECEILVQSSNCQQHSFLKMANDFFLKKYIFLFLGRGRRRCPHPQLPGGLPAGEEGGREGQV